MYSKIKNIKSFNIDSVQESEKGVLISGGSNFRMTNLPTKNMCELTSQG